MKSSLKGLFALLRGKAGQSYTLFRALFGQFAQQFKVSTLTVMQHIGKFWVPSATHEMHIKYYSELEQIKPFLKLLLPGDIVWDVGANMGFYSIFSAKATGKKGEIYAFEPEKRTRRILQVNRLINRVSTKLFVVPIALGKYTGDIILYESKVNKGGHSCLYRKGDSLSKGQKVAIARADELKRLRKIPNPCVIKIDVEGAEYDVCDGFRNLFLTSPPRMLFIEVHPELIKEFGHSVQNLHSLLRENNYSITNLGARGTEEHWIALQGDNTAPGGPEWMQ